MFMDVRMCECIVCMKGKPIKFVIFPFWFTAPVVSSHFILDYTLLCLLYFSCLSL
jgi:hypothetical protein